MEVGKWKLEIGKWKMEVGKWNWKSENGNWKMEVGKWKLENGNWKLENGNRKREMAWHLSATVYTSPETHTCEVLSNGVVEIIHLSMLAPPTRGRVGNFPCLEWQICPRGRDIESKFQSFKVYHEHGP